MRIRWLVVATAAATLLVGCGTQTSGTGHPTFPPGNPTRGAKLFATTCASCHGPQAQGTPGLAPSLTAKSLTELYTAPWELSEFIYQYMPKSNPGSLTRQQAADLGAFLWGLNGKLGAGTKRKLLALIGAPSSPPSSPSSSSSASAPPSSSTSPSSQSPSSPSAAKFLSVNAAAKTVTLTVVASYTGTNSGLNFDGFAKGAMTVTVPTGWKVDVNFSNKGPLPHSVAVVSGANSTSPAFPGAAMPSSELQSGIAAGQSTSFSFTAGKPGSYRIACLVPGHETLGMWDRFVVSSAGQPSIKP